LRSEELDNIVLWFVIDMRGESLRLC